MYREWDQLPDRGGEWGVTSQLPPAASSPGQEGTGALSDLLPAQGCHIPARGCPFPPPGAHTVSGTEGHPARGGEGSVTDPQPWSHRGHCPTPSILRVTQARWAKDSEILLSAN